MRYRCLALYLQQPNNIIEFCTRNEVVNLVYPAANVTLNESDQEENAAVGVVWGMLKILSFPCWNASSELEVERHVGSCLASFFNIKDCITIS